MCLLNEKWIEEITEQTAEKGIAEFPFEVVFFVDGNRRKHTESLSQNGKSAEGNEKSSKSQPKAQRVRGTT